MKKAAAPQKLSHLIIGTLGVVYGDIGTSPLYALKGCFKIGHMSVDLFNVLGIISLFIWILFIVVSIKYVHFVLKMHNQGEGGTLALSTLVAAHVGKHTRTRSIAVGLGIGGAALFFGDGVITPAISVLSAVEGLSVIHPHFTHYIVPITCVILTGLFAIQKFGSGRIGHYFGPIMSLWFLILCITGAHQIYQMPIILKALNPYYALCFLYHHAWMGAAIMGGVILVVTGAEALYADLGHFGAKPIHYSWSYFVFPSLIIHYLGQGALLLHTPTALNNVFFLMAPHWALNGLIALSTIATIIASQSILSGLFSITYHCILKNYFPRLKVKHTSESLRGQIYIPTINSLIYVLTIGAVWKFQSSENLAVAYGLCIASIMLITTGLVFIIVWKRQTWPLWKILSVFMPLFCIDGLFFITNIVKIAEGGWYVLLITGCVYACMRIWIRGSKAFGKQKAPITITVRRFITKHLKYCPKRSPGAALFFSKKPLHPSHTFLVNVQHNKYIHKTVLFVSFITLDTPYHVQKEHFYIQKILPGVFQVTVKYGFMEKPSVHKLLQWLERENIVDPEDVSVFLSRGVPIRTKSPWLSSIGETIYLYLSSIAQNPMDFYHIPHHKVMEIGIIYRI